MSKSIINKLEKEQIKKNLPRFRSGDVVEVQIWVVEGSKKRIQVFEGIVIAIRNRGLNSSFTVRKVSHGEGIERVFQTHSPVLENIVIKRRSFVRKAKLYHLRDRIGRSARMKEKIN